MYIGIFTVCVCVCVYKNCKLALMYTAILKFRAI